jgi:D-erythrose 4-phosphate dehydrogenase
VLRIAINGYGRIGRSFLRAVYESKAREMLQVVAINEPADAKTIAYLTRYDSTHGRFPGTVGLQGLSLQINGDSINLLAVEDILDLPWRDLDVDVVLECSGTFSDRRSAEQHIQSGAQRVLFSQPAQPDVDQTIVFGVNQNELNGSETIISAASCTTNAVVPVIHVLDETFGVGGGVITTIHSAMNDQPVIDAFHHNDLRKTRAAMQSIIPVETGLALGIGRLMPHLEGYFEAQAMRVPTINVSCIDLSVMLNTDIDAKQINECLAKAAFESLEDILGYSEEPLASCDFNHDSRSGVVDASQTRVSQKKLAKVLIWFDNEWGYANRMLDILLHWSNSSSSIQNWKESG